MSSTDPAVQPAPDENPEGGEEREELKKEILQQLRIAANSEARVRTFARYADTYGLEAIVSFIPEIGDAGASGLAGIYLLLEAKKADLSKTSYLKIIGLQAADFFIGMVPLAGDTVDFLWKANKWSTIDFEKKTDELIKKAREAGVTEEDIAKITDLPEKIVRLVNRAITLSKPLRNQKA